MRRVSPEVLNEPVEALLQARLSRAEFDSLFPIEFERIDVFGAPEPSLGALIQLTNGRLLVVNYGLETGVAQLDVPRSMSETERRYTIDEIPIPPRAITWRSTSVASTAAGLSGMRRVVVAAVSNFLLRRRGSTWFFNVDELRTFLQSGTIALARRPAVRNELQKVQEELRNLDAAIERLREKITAEEAGKPPDEDPQSHPIIEPNVSRERLPSEEHALPDGGHTRIGRSDG